MSETSYLMAINYKHDTETTVVDHIQRMLEELDDLVGVQFKLLGKLPHRLVTLSGSSH